MGNKEEKGKQKNGRMKTKLLICLLYVAVLSTATYAWFTLNNKPKVYNLSLIAGGAADLQIADDLGGGPGEYGDELNLQEANKSPSDMEQMELNPVTTQNAVTFYSPIYSGDTVTGADEITDKQMLNESYVYEKTFYLRAGSIKTGSGKKVGGGNKSYDIMLLGPKQEEEYTGCVIEQANDSQAEGSDTAANSLRIAFLVEGQDAAIYEPNSGKSNSSNERAGDNVKGQYGDYDTLKQPGPGEAFEGGENGNSKKLFTIREDEDVKVTMLVWIEGTDEDCTNSIQMDKIIGNIQFTSQDASGTGNQRG